MLNMAMGGLTLLPLSFQMPAIPHVFGQYPLNILISTFLFLGKWFEPRGISYLFGMIVQEKVVFRKTVVGG